MVVLFKYKGVRHLLKLHFIRHGETEWNVENRLQGSLDSPLTKRGREAVKELKKQTDCIKWRAVYASPSGRAIETASLLTDIDKIVRDERLKEMNLDKFEGLTWDEVKLMNEQQYYYYWHAPDKFSLPYAETFLEVEDRVRHFLKDIKETYSYGNVMIVTHGVIIKIAEMIINQQKLAFLWERPHVKGASITAFKLDS